MTLARWYRWMLVLPFALPVLTGMVCFILTGSLTGEIAAPAPGFETNIPPHVLAVSVVASLHATLLQSVIVAGIPYALFALISAWLFRGRDNFFWCRFLWQLPLWFLPFCVIGVQLIHANPPSVFWGTFWVGYFYVILAHTLTRIALKKGWVTPMEKHITLP